jgi:hypothetical protein
VRRLSIRGLLPDTDHYMTYDGSFTSPACHETVTWVVLNKPIYITKQQASGFPFPSAPCHFIRRSCAGIKIHRCKKNGAHLRVFGCDSGRFLLYVLCTSSTALLVQLFLIAAEFWHVKRVTPRCLTCKPISIRRALDNERGLNKGRSLFCIQIFIKNDTVPVMKSR